MHLRRLVVPALVPVAFFAGTFVNAAQSAPQEQQEQPLVVVVDYMKVPTGGGATYESLEKDIWKKIHQERQRQGIASSWAVYSVRFPQGTTREYDYVTVNTYKSLGDLDRGYANELIRKAVPNIPLDQLISRTVTARQNVRSDIWYLVDKTP